MLGCMEGLAGSYLADEAEAQSATAVPAICPATTMEFIPLLLVHKHAFV